MEEILKRIIGDLVFQNASLQAQLTEANKKLEGLNTEPKKEP